MNDQSEIQKPAKHWFDDAKSTIVNSSDVISFIKYHELWKGFKSYTWLIKGLVILAVLLGFSMLDTIPQLFTNEANLFGFMEDASLAKLNAQFTESYKYLILILVEIIIFHFTRKTLMIVGGEMIPTDFKSFISAEKRMIKIAAFSYIMETVVHFASNTALSIIGWSSLSGAFFFLIQSFYLGFAIVDNYNEIFDMTMKQSHRFTWHHAPVALITGAMILLIMNIPFIGVIIGPIICSVIATLTMYEITKSSDLSWVYVEKEKKDKKKKKKSD